VGADVAMLIFGGRCLGEKGANVLRFSRTFGTRRTRLLPAFEPCCFLNLSKMKILAARAFLFYRGDMKSIRGRTAPVSGGTVPIALNNRGADSLMLFEVPRHFGHISTGGRLAGELLHY